MPEKPTSRIFLIVAALTVFFTGPARAADETPENWPCEQRYDPKISLAAVWNGPPVEDVIDSWWQDGAVFEAVEELKDPLLTEQETEELIEKFTANISGDKKESLRRLFAGLYQRAMERRRVQQSGILRFAERQNDVTRKISEASKKLRQLRKAGVDNESREFKDLVQQMEWNTRVYDERTRLTEYMCEEPVFTVQNLGVAARLIQARLKD